MECEKKAGLRPGLAVILVGDDPASQVYVKHKIKACKDVGILSYEYRLDKDCSLEALRATITSLNIDPKIHGILLQLPLPKHLPAAELIDLISPLKDPDGLTTVNMGLLFSGKPRVVSCTPSGVMSLLKEYKVPLEGSQAVVIGRSNIVGKPMAMLLQNANATVSVIHSKTQESKEYTQKADIVVVAAGVPEHFGKDDFKEGAVVIDVGIHRKSSKNGESYLVGDVRYKELENWCKAASPVPGGAGPMTIVSLLENTFELFKNSLDPEKST